jgi:hypothetical protein
MNGNEYVENMTMYGRIILKRMFIIKSISLRFAFWWFKIVSSGCFFFEQAQ